MRPRVKIRMRKTLRVLPVLLISHALLWPILTVQAQELFDPEIRAAMLKQKNGLIAHVETAYNDIFVTKN